LRLRVAVVKRDSDMLIPGFASEEGTARFRDRFAARLPGHFRATQGLWISSIGIGTYLGEPTSKQDARYRDAIRRAVSLGVNIIDSAINYRHQRSERAIAQALAASISAGEIRRDEIVVASKAGFLSFDGEEPADPSAYFQERFLDPGIIRMEEVVAGCHVISPKYLENQIDASRGNLGLETIDIYYVHNPETQLSQVGREEFFRRLRAAFAALEKAVTEGKIRMYGTATWNAYRATPTSTEALSLTDVLRVAEEVGGKDHHFRAIQLPFSLAMPEAAVANTQPTDRKPVPLLQVARAHGLLVFASAPLLQGQLTQGLPPEFRSWFPRMQTDAQRAIQFVRSTPGIASALVGMSNLEHVRENLGTALAEPMTLEQFRAILQGDVK
jgi:aryl-alcohol dehydrogenase-like predicted oxidoreductase